MGKLDTKDIENILSLTPMQEGLLFHYLKDPRSSLYFEQLSLVISAAIEVDLFIKAWNVISQANEMLRTVFRWEKLEKPSQIILKEHPCEIRFHNFSGIDEGQKKTALSKVKIDDRVEAFDLTHVPFRVTLCKLDESQYQMIISNHHILYDGWSNGILLKEFFNVYHALTKGEQALPFPFKPSFKEYIKWLQSRDKKKQEHYWCTYLADFETATELPIKKKKEELTGTGDYSIILEEDIKVQLEVFVKNNRVTLASVFYSTWGILLQKYCDSGDVIFGTPVSGRGAALKGIKDMVGLFINTVPLRMQSAPTAELIDIISAMENDLKMQTEFESTPLPDIRSYSTVDGSGSLFDTLVVIENYPLDNRLLPENSLLSIHSYSMVEMTHYDLSIGIMPFNEIEIKFSFKQELFEKEIIENLAGHFKGIIRNLITTPAMKISQLEIISTEEKNRILNEFNNTAVEYPRDKTIHQLFEEQASRTPDRIAVFGHGQIQTNTDNHVGADLRVCPARNVCPVNLTYRQLNEQSDKLAGMLIDRGVQPDAIVAIMVERSVEMVVGIMGILKSGGVYLPIDLEYPVERIKYMLKDSGAKLLAVANDQEGEKVGKWEVEKVLLAEISKSPQSPSYPLTILPSNLQNTSNLAYLIYTSGSTGNPKGVMGEHCSIFNTIYYRMQEYKMEVIDRALQLFSIAFDGFLTSFFTPVVSGASVVLASGDEAKDITRIKKIIVAIKITHFICVPSLYRWLLDGTVAKEFSSLKVVTLAGEQVRPDLMEKSKQLFPFLEVVNEYGPTESSVLTSIHRDIQPDAAISIGKPIPNTGIYIIDKDHNLAPIGIPGQLVIYGKGLARGYLNRPELTAEKFCFSPMFPKLYKTGDLARWLPDHETSAYKDQRVSHRTG